MMLKGNHPRKKLPALNQLFFIETECTFPTGANHAWDVACPIGTQSPAHIQPCDPFYRAPRRRRLYQLFFARHHGGKPWQKSDDHQTQGTACQQSGSIQSIYCFRGHFHVLVFFCLTLQTLLGFSLWVIDTLQVLNYNTGSLQMQLSAH